MSADDDNDGEEAPAWLTSYSDMMTDLLAIFVILFSFAMMAVAQQNYTLKTELEEAEDVASLSAEEQGGSGGTDQVASDFDKIYEAIKEKVNESGYADTILLDKTDEYINFRFKDTVLFYPDSPTMRETSFDILQYMGDLLLSVDSSIDTIEISGYTAKVGEDVSTNYVAWKLSADRAISVLNFFVSNCDLPQSKMSIAGYSHYRPVADNDNEENRSQNRRVEVKITRVSS